jgi:hypothetical protein
MQPTPARSPAVCRVTLGPTAAAMSALWWPGLSGQGSGRHSLPGVGDVAVADAAEPDLNEEVVRAEVAALGGHRGSGSVAEVAPYALTVSML